MLNPKTNLRELAYVVKIDNVLDMEGVNNQIAVVNGWTVFVKRDQFHTGDLAIYFEIDSKVPATEQFAFLEKYKYAVKTQKYCKGRVISQGLLMHPSDFGWEVYGDHPYIKNIEDGVIIDENSNPIYYGDFLTERLGVTYYEPEDNSRKANMKEVLQKKLDNSIAKWVKKHPVLAKLPFIKKIKYALLRKKIFTKKAKKKANWPSWVVKTDEERCQNMPILFNKESDLHKKRYIGTEKIDGTSSTFTCHRDGKNNIYLVCSRNVVFDKPDKKSFYDDTDGNVYLEMSIKYEIEKVLTHILKNNKDLVYVTMQGESYGGGIQKRKYCDEHRLAMFNLIFGYKNGEVIRFNPIEMTEKITTFNGECNTSLECVPIVYEEFYLPDTCEELLKIAEGKSLIDGEPREGLVLRSLDGKVSFKAVSNSFLLKYHG